MGVEPTDTRQGLSLAALPACVPCQASPMGFEPTASTLTGWRALLAAPRGQSSVARVGVEPTASFGLSKGGLPVAYRADTFQFRRLESNQHQRVQSPMSYRLDNPGAISLNQRSSGRRGRTFTSSFKDCRPTISRSPNAEGEGVDPS